MNKELENELDAVIDDAYDCEITSRYIKADQLVLDLDCLLLDFNSTKGKRLFQEWYREEGSLLFREYAAKH